MRKSILCRAAVACAAVVATTGPADAATPIYPMIALTITARAGTAPTFAVTAQAPTPWACAEQQWSLGTFVVACVPPMAPTGFENTCLWNAVVVQSAGIPGFGPLNARASCDADTGANASTGSGGANSGTATPNMQFGTFYCTANGGAFEPSTRPWTVTCTANH